jgi:hypothetical protein
MGDMDLDFLGAMPEVQRKEFETLVTTLVLATDIAADKTTLPRCRELVELGRAWQISPAASSTHTLNPHFA